MVSDFFTWEMLATYAGATLAVTAITQMLKGIPLIQKIPTQIFSYIIALIVLEAANYFTGNMTVSTAVIALLNAVVVSLASNGAYEAVVSVAKKE